MGPTASGKTEVAIRLADDYPVDLVSVDSALIYRGMDIGTAKPKPDILQHYPHALVDIRDPEDTYSAGDFVRDAQLEIDAAHAAGRLPLLVGGTMLYFRSLVHGIAELPEADAGIRAAIDEEALARGWPSLHAELAEIDPTTAARISPNDSQRIQRALEVYRVSGRSLTDWHDTGRPTREDYRFIKYALIPEPRRTLHERMEARLDQMLGAGFIDEVRGLMRREGLTAQHPSMRAVGYRQIWAHLAGETSLEEARQRALAATRQLAKRQLTWLRSEDGLNVLDPLETDATSAISENLAEAAGIRKN
jgi:tRNA dimethylallyltransferase